MDSYRTEPESVSLDYNICSDCGKEIEYPSRVCTICKTRYDKNSRIEQEMIDHPCDEFIE